MIHLKTRIGPRTADGTDLACFMSIRGTWQSKNNNRTKSLVYNAPPPLSTSAPGTKPMFMGRIKYGIMMLLACVFDTRPELKQSNGVCATAITNVDDFYYFFSRVQFASVFRRRRCPCKRWWVVQKALCFFYVITTIVIRFFPIFYFGILFFR